MTNRVQSLRSSIAGNRPTGRLPGELYVNLADAQLGVINAGSTAQDLLPVRIFQVSANYNIGDHVLQGGFLWRAIATVAAGSFNSTQWQQIIPNALPLSGGTMTGDLILNRDPVATLQAATKHYVDNAVIGGVVTNPNRLINGDMRISQRWGAASNSVSASGLYTVDRWRADQVNTGVGNLLGVGQNYHGIAPPAGFPNYFSIAGFPVYTPMAPSAYCLFSQYIEADAISDLQWGTPNALPVTLSFWVNVTLPGPYAVILANSGRTRSYVATFTPTVGAWTYVTITIPGDQGGTWLTSGNGVGLGVSFSLGAGTNYRTTAGAWASGMFFTTSTCRNIVEFSSAYLDLTGVKLEAGSIATPFPQQSLAQSLVDCQRYYQQLGGGASNTVGIQGYAGTASTQSCTIGYQAMRAAPTAAAVDSFTAINAGTVNMYPGLQTMLLQANPPAAGGFQYYNASASSFISLSAEF